MRQLLLAGVVLAGLASGSARAADVIWGPPPVYGVAALPPGLFSWSGFYLGGHVGWGWGNFEIRSPEHTHGTNVNGGVAGVQGGFNWQWNPIVFGVEVDASAKQFNGNDGAPFGVLNRFDGRRGWGGTVRARVGYAVDRWLFFATGGWALLNYRYAATILDGPGVVFPNHDNGWVVGGGIEQAFAPNWSAKLEYLHMDYGDHNRAAAIFVNPFTTHFASDELRFGLNYRFLLDY
jgi:outer membrane immunogenic protein